MSLYYLATPYSKYPAGIVAAFEDAAAQAALLIRNGIPAYSPIAHTHPVAIHGKLDPYDHNLWLALDEHMMAAARGLIVCKMEGWDVSYGISHEIAWFKERGKPIFYMEPGVVPELA